MEEADETQSGKEEDISRDGWRREAKESTRGGVGKNGDRLEMEKTD